MITLKFRNARQMMDELRELGLVPPEKTGPDADTRPAQFVPDQTCCDNASSAAVISVPTITRTLGGDRWDGLKQAQAQADAAAAEIDRVTAAGQETLQKIDDMGSRAAVFDRAAKQTVAACSAAAASDELNAAIDVATQDAIMYGAGYYAVKRDKNGDPVHAHVPVDQVLRLGARNDAQDKQAAIIRALCDEADNLRKMVVHTKGEYGRLSTAYATAIAKANENSCQLSRDLKTARDERDQARGELGRYADQVQELQALSRSYQWRILSMQREAGVANAAGLPAIDPIDIDPTAGSPPA